MARKALGGGGGRGGRGGMVGTAVAVGVVTAVALLGAPLLPRIMQPPTVVRRKIEEKRLLEMRAEQEALHGNTERQELLSKLASELEGQTEKVNVNRVRRGVFANTGSIDEGDDPHWGVRDGEWVYIGPPEDEKPDMHLSGAGAGAGAGPVPDGAATAPPET